MLKIFVPKETVPGETRAAATPDSVRRTLKRGASVTVESGIGAACAIGDEAFEAAGATVVSDAAAGYADADLVLRYHPPQRGSDDEVALLREGSALLSFLFPLSDHDLVRALAERKVTSIAVDMIPRISRAQKMDALSSQANIAGYKAVILAADHLKKMFPLMMTAAGTITPAKVVVVGAGVAGLQALATAKRLGAVVDVSDIRPVVKEQVESLGGRFIDVPTDEGAEDAGGYAKEASEEFKRRQEEELRKRLREADVLITTAQIPGRPAPKLISEEMIAEMPRGAVIVDLAAEQGGNCALTRPGEVADVDGITIVGLRNIPAMVPIHATDMYAKNLYNFLQDFLKEGELNLDPEDEIIAGALITRDGQIVHAATKERIEQGASR